MRTTLSDNNPHGYDRYGYAWEHISAGSAAHLDVGCDDGFFLNSLSGKEIAYLVGVDVARDAINEGRKLYPFLNLQHTTTLPPLPYKDNTFTSVSLLDVLEHVYEQRTLLKDIYRVLKPGGHIIVTVPRYHLFSFLDRGNVQFYWPALHKWYYLRTHSLQEYNYHYVNNPDNLVGCVSAKKRWHEHFSQDHLRNWLEISGFTIKQFDGTGLMKRVIDTANFAMGKPARLKPYMQKAMDFDNRHFGFCDLFCLAEKQA